MAKDCPHEHECHRRFDDIDKSFDETNKSLNDIKDFLWRGNGKTSLLVQVDRLNIFKKVACWLISACTIACLGLIVRLVYSHVTGH